MMALVGKETDLSGVRFIWRERNWVSRVHVRWMHKQDEEEEKEDEERRSGLKDKPNEDAESG